MAGKGLGKGLFLSLVVVTENCLLCDDSSSTNLITYALDVCYIAISIFILKILQSWSGGQQRQQNLMQKQGNCFNNNVYISEEHSPSIKNYSHTGIVLRQMLFVEILLGSRANCHVILRV